MPQPPTEPTPGEPTTPGASAHDPEDRPRRYPSTVGGALYLLVLAATVAGVVLVALGPWRGGVRVVAGALVAAAGLRLVLRSKDAGMLAVRHRAFDVGLLLAVGGTLFFLASSIPDQPV